MEGENTYKSMKDIRDIQVCPFFNNPPTADCYCVDANSVNIPSILKYCVKDFNTCGRTKFILHKRTFIK